MAAWWRRPSRQAHGVDKWVTREFAVRGLSPPDCTPEALARALEGERQITIAFRPHTSEDPGVYGLLYRQAAYQHLYVILFRPTPSIVLRRLILFHELAHILFAHTLTEVASVDVRCGYKGVEAEEAVAEAFAVGAMQYSFLDPVASRTSPPAEDDDVMSVFGQFLTKTQYRP